MTGDCGSCSTGGCSDDKDRLPPGMLSVYNLNQQTGLGTLIWAETIIDGGSVTIHPAVFEILGKIRDISDDRIFAMITGSVDIKPLYRELFEHGVDTLYHIRGKDMETYRPEAYAEALADLSDRVNPMSIIIPGTTLSQLGIKTKPSKACPKAILSTVAAMISRDGREYFIPT